MLRGCQGLHHLVLAFLRSALAERAEQDQAPVPCWRLRPCSCGHNFVRPCLCCCLASGNEVSNTRHLRFWRLFAGPCHLFDGPHPSFGHWNPPKTNGGEDRIANTRFRQYQQWPLGRPYVSRLALSAAWTSAAAPNCCSDCVHRSSQVIVLRANPQHPSHAIPLTPFPPCPSWGENWENSDSVGVDGRC